MRYINFCSGSKGNCTLIETQQTRLIIDCGSTKSYLTQSLHTWGVHLNTVDALLITHSHGDHIAQLKMFDSIPLCYSPVALERRSSWITPMPYVPFWIKDIQVTPIVLSHDSGLTYGYVFEHNHEKLVYVTDTGYLKERDFEYIRNADYYLFESNHDVDMLMNTTRPYPTKARILSDNGHLSNQDSSAILAAVIGPQTKEIVLAHLSEEANTPELARSVLLETLAEIKCHPQLNIVCASQTQSISGGHLDEKQLSQNLNLNFARLK